MLVLLEGRDEVGQKYPANRSDPRQQIGQISDEFGVTADDDGSGLGRDQHD